MWKSNTTRERIQSGHMVWSRNSIPTTQAGLPPSDGSGQIFVARVGLGQPFMVWLWIWKISPKNVKFFNIFPFGSKKISSGQKVPGSKAGRPLIYCGSKVSSGRVESEPISTPAQINTKGKKDKRPSVCL